VPDAGVIKSAHHDDAAALLAAGGGHDLRGGGAGGGDIDEAGGGARPDAGMGFRRGVVVTGLGGAVGAVGVGADGAGGMEIDEACGGAIPNAGMQITASDGVAGLLAGADAVDVGGVHAGGLDVHETGGAAIPEAGMAIGGAGLPGGGKAGEARAGGARGVEIDGRPGLRGEWAAEEQERTEKRGESARQRGSAERTTGGFHEANNMPRQRRTPSGRWMIRGSGIAGRIQALRAKMERRVSIVPSLYDRTWKMPDCAGGVICDNNLTHEIHERETILDGAPHGDLRAGNGAGEEEGFGFLGVRGELQGAADDARPVQQLLPGECGHDRQSFEEREIGCHRRQWLVDGVGDGLPTQRHLHAATQYDLGG